MRRTTVLLTIAALLTACNRDNARQRDARDEVSQSLAKARTDAPMREMAVSGAAQASGYVSPTAPAPSDASATQLPSAHAVSDSVVSSMIIRTGQASIEVDSLERGIRAVRALAGRVGGYVANSSIAAGAEQTHTATLEIKIPAARFDDAIGGLQPIGQLESVSVSAEDVGEEFVDVAARATNGRKLEQRLIDILGTRTGKLSDVLAVERELARVREDIERQEGRMRYLRTRASLSTLSVTVHEKAPVVAGTGSGGMLADAFRQAWRNFIGFIASAIAAMGTLLPLGAIVGAIVWLVWRARRARRVTEKASS
ncbi:MAG TPA: DUF4349 domain-containing protein [Gemmatimonadaceae bacterium]|jgi:hypothetical protein|nr:DUF4349 domain-containing protein [Gemmatimonadaceae bacterium]